MVDSGEDPELHETLGACARILLTENADAQGSGNDQGVGRVKLHGRPALGWLIAKGEDPEFHETPGVSSTDPMINEENRQDLLRQRK